MRWDKLQPLVAKVDSTYERARSDLEAFIAFIEQQSEKPDRTPSMRLIVSALQ